MYDVIIIGMGIAGVSSAIYLKRAGLKVLILEKGMPGGTLNYISNINNYPGISEITGQDFALNLIETINNLKIDYKFEDVIEITTDKIKTVKTKSNTYTTLNIIIACGRKPRLLGLKDEDKYLGKGISTCALCDGPLYKDKEIAVVGGGESALSECIYLAKLAKKVYLIHRRDNFRAQDETIKKVKSLKNIKLILNKEIKNIKKDTEFRGVILNDNQEIDVSALFLYIGSVPNTMFLDNTDIQMENNYLIVDDKYETNVEGIYAIGDCIKKDIYQLINAASEGAICAINISKKY